MTRSGKKRRWRSGSLLQRAMLASAGVHLAAATCLLASLFVGILLPLDAPGDATTTQIVEIPALTIWTDPPEPLVELHAGQDEVLISPDMARIAERRFFETPAIEVSLQELLSPETYEIVLAEELLEERDSPALEEELQRPRESLLDMLPPAARPQQQPTPPRDDRAGLTAPDFRGNRPPRYPAQAVRQRLEGVVMLRLTLAADGRVTDVKVIESSGYKILDAAAVATVRTWKSKPATRRGKPVTTVWDLPVRFRLN